VERLVAGRKWQPDRRLCSARRQPDGTQTRCTGDRAGGSTEPGKKRGDRAGAAMRRARAGARRQRERTQSTRRCVHRRPAQSVGGGERRLPAPRATTAVSGGQRGAKRGGPGVTAATPGPKPASPANTPARPAGPLTGSGGGHECGRKLRAAARANRPGASSLSAEEDRGPEGSAGGREGRRARAVNRCARARANSAASGAGRPTNAARGREPAARSPSAENTWHPTRRVAAATTAMQRRKARWTKQPVRRRVRRWRLLRKRRMQ